MIAATARRFGPPEVLRLETLPDPVPGPGQLLIRVQAFAVTRGDTRIRALQAPPGMALPMRLAFGPFRPRRIIPGREFSGTVEAIGPGVTGWAPGEAIMGLTDGLTMGAGAELVTVSAKGRIARRPASLGPEQAAGVFFGLLTAADFLIDQARLKPGEHLLINGATGAVGVAALQLARHLGARITATASPPNHALARALGAHDTADYTRPLPPGPWDVILDIAGTLPWPAARPTLAPGGRLCLVTAGLGALLGATLRPNRGPHRLCAGIVKETPQAISRALALHQAGAFTPQITALPMDHIQEAHRRAGSGHHPGAMVVTL